MVINHSHLDNYDLHLQLYNSVIVCCQLTGWLKASIPATKRATLGLILDCYFVFFHGYTSSHRSSGLMSFRQLFLRNWLYTHLLIYPSTGAVTSILKHLTYMMNVWWCNLLIYAAEDFKLRYPDIPRAWKLALDFFSDICNCRINDTWYFSLKTFQYAFH